MIVSQVNFINNYNLASNITEIFTYYINLSLSNIYYENNYNFNVSHSDIENILIFDDYCSETPGSNKNWTPLIISLSILGVILASISIFACFRLHKRFQKIENRIELERSLVTDYG